MKYKNIGNFQLIVNYLQTPIIPLFYWCFVYEIFLDTFTWDTILYRIRERNVTLNLTKHIFASPTKFRSYYPLASLPTRYICQPFVCTLYFVLLVSLIRRLSQWHYRDMRNRDTTRRFGLSRVLSWFAWLRQSSRLLASAIDSPFLRTTQPTSSIH